jgi:hypothetical protein
LDSTAFALTSKLPLKKEAVEGKARVTEKQARSGCCRISNCQEDNSYNNDNNYEYQHSSLKRKLVEFIKKCQIKKEITKSFF